MRILPKIFNEALNLIYNILNQGDHRYNDFEKENLLAGSILKEVVF